MGGRQSRRRVRDYTPTPSPQVQVRLVAPKVVKSVRRKKAREKVPTKPQIIELQFHVLPEWASKDPIVTGRRVELVQRSWTMVIEGTMTSNDAYVDFSGLTKSATKSGSGTRSLNEKKNQAKKVSPPNSRVGTGKTKTPGPARSTLFFASFFRHLFTILPQAELKLPQDLNGRAGIMSRVVGFIVKESGDLDSLKTNERIRQLMIMHNKMELPARFYGAMMQTLIITLKKFLGQHFNKDTHNAWMAVLSKLLVKMLKYCPKRLEVRVYPIRP